MLRLFTTAKTETRPDHPDPVLRDRRYAVPFAQVWEAVLDLMKGGISGWKLTHADEDAGEAMAEVASLLARQPHEVTVHIWLDPDGQTCMNVQSCKRTSRSDLGASRRHVTAFLRSLDRHLKV